MSIIVNSKINFCFCSNEMQLCRIWRAKQKTDNDSKCRQTAQGAYWLGEEVRGY